MRCIKPVAVTNSPVYARGGRKISSAQTVGVREVQVLFSAYVYSGRASWPGVGNTNLSSTRTASPEVSSLWLQVQRTCGPGGSSLGC